MGAYVYGIRIASLWNAKALQWVTGRKKIFQEIKAWKSDLQPSAKIVWMHCASLGEFEQGRPVAEMIKKQYPDCKVLISFFSPSGYEVRRNYAGADAVFYLPSDSKKNADLFIDIIAPSLVVWVKYEYWYHYLHGLKERNIPVILISALFRNSRPLFNQYISLRKAMLKCFRQIFVQDEKSARILQSSGISSNVTAAGDTRFDRVISIAENDSALPDQLIEFCNGFKVIVAGSTWEEDEEEIVHYAKMHPQVKFIIAPHEIDDGRLQDIQKLFPRTILFSRFASAESEVQTVIIDNIGMLSKLYQLADIGYIGGGFNDSGIHNILEAAVYGKPVIFGPEFEKFAEATELVERGGAFSINNALELEDMLDKLLTNEEYRLKIAGISNRYVYEKRGATEKVMEFIQENRLLTS